MTAFFSKQFLLFLFTGGIAAAVNFGSRILYNQITSFSVAILLAYITGMLTAFILAKLFVFKDTQNSVSKSAFYFTLVNLVAILQTWGVSMLLAYVLLPQIGISQYKNEIAHFVGVIVPVFTSYIGHKKWSFKEQQEP